MVKCSLQSTLRELNLAILKLSPISECEQQEDSDNDKYSGELVPIISRISFDDEATKF